MISHGERAERVPSAAEGSPDLFVIRCSRTSALASALALVLCSTVLVLGGPGKLLSREMALVREVEDTEQSSHGLNAAVVPWDVKEDPNTDPVGLASCVLDVSEASVFLGLAGTTITATVEGCKPPLLTDADIAKCSTCVNGVIFLLAYAATFLASAATHCAGTLNLEANCAADILNLVGALTVLGSSASSMSQSCPMPDSLSKILPPHASEWYEKRRLVAPSSPELDPVIRNFSYAIQASTKEPYDRLMELAAAKQKQRDRKLVEANCIFHALGVPIFLSRAGLALTAAVKDCNPMAMRKTEAEKGSPAEAQMGCTVDIVGVLGSFMWMGRVLSLAINQCPIYEHPNGPFNTKAVCVADIFTVIGALAGISASGADFMLSCGRLPPTDLSPGGRRLEDRISEEDEQQAVIP